jgi:hypothetical protein
MSTIPPWTVTEDRNSGDELIGYYRRRVYDDGRRETQYRRAGGRWAWRCIDFVPKRFMVG